MFFCCLSWEIYVTPTPSSCWGQPLPAACGSGPFSATSNHHGGVWSLLLSQPWADPIPQWPEADRDEPWVNEEKEQRSWLPNGLHSLKAWMGGSHCGGIERRGRQDRGCCKYLPWILLLMRGRHQKQTEKDKKTPTAGSKDHLRNWRPGTGRDLPKIAYWENQWQSLPTLLYRVFLSTSQLKTLPNLELGPVFFWSCDSILSNPSLGSLFLTIKARLLGMNYRACSCLAPAYLSTHILSQDPTYHWAFAHAVLSAWNDLLSLFLLFDSYFSTQFKCVFIGKSTWLGQVS